MNFALVLTTNRVAGTRVELGNPSPDAMRVSYTNDAEMTERHLESSLLGFSATSQTRTTVMAQANDAVAAQAEQDFQLGAADAGMAAKGVRRYNVRPLGNGQPPVDAKSAVMAGLLLGSPEFQRR